jgi:histidyl-tRNA synthetase
VLLGPDEVARGVAAVRTMSTGEQQELPLADMLEPSAPTG